ncbi:hypothetical protein [Pseudomonas sp.]|uniref:hypothetical protein n=1 Tax=Pseudomonas sp. TaxID=306 RepID=UPI003C3D0CC8
MTPDSSVDDKSFRTLLSRNVALGLDVGVLSAVFFVCLIAYLLSVLQWVEHTERVTVRVCARTVLRVFN